ncbi:MAG: T9SS type A sorting domain-containing protein, partial [Bacteroidota bacterium]|nr:T9SS type A sorting domain-containing protein [Bacteroidota bacterium]
YGSSSGNIFFYENNGTLTAPHFLYSSNYFQVVKTFGAATVSFGDFDKDGKIDLLSGNNTGKFSYFKNTGTAESPIFTATSNAITNINPGSYSTPVFVDLNNDGQLDIVSGSLGGKLFCYINNNGSFTQNTTMFSSVDVSGFSAPAFGDINGDGNIDMLVGAETGSNSKFYMNSGNNNFVVNDTMMAGVVFPSQTRPVFADVDGDGDLDLVMGNAWGDIYYYENTGNKLHPVWTKNDTLFASIGVKQMASPGFANLFHTGRKDFVIGEYDGNFSLYKNLFGNPAAVKEINSDIPSNFVLNQNYPNPFNPSTTIRYSIPLSGNVTLKIYDVLGKEVVSLVNEYQTAGTYSVEFNGTKLSSGIYFYSLNNGSNVLTKKLVLLK